MSATMTRPDWLSKTRDEARTGFEGDPGPARSSAIWKRTPFSRYRLEKLPAEVSAASGPDVPAPDGFAGVFRQIDASAAARLGGGLEAQGVYLGDLETAAVERPELVRPHLEGFWGGPDERKLELAKRGASQARRQLSQAAEVQMR